MWKARAAIAASLLTAMGIGALGAGPAHAAFDAVMSCAQATACLEWDNTKGGDAVKGVSKGNAIHGQTKFNSAGKTAGKAGVFGEDLSTSGNLNAGVNGVSTNGAGVLGMSTSWNAVEGLSTNSTGVYGQTAAAAGFGVAGRNTSTTHDNGGAGILADGGPASDGIHAFANGAGFNGVYAFSQSGSAIVANTGPSDASPELSLQDTSSTINDIIKAVGKPGNVLELQNNGDAILTGTVEIDNHALHNVPLLIRAATTGVGDTVVSIINGTGGNDMRVDDSGNVVIGGLIYTAGSCGGGCLVGNRQVRTVSTYAPEEAEPTVEDNGEATLVGGRAEVALDPKFANVIDTTKPYLVTITPEGDSRGLYVTDRSAVGFTVRESQGGRSSIGFVYRIVAKRYGVNAPRLPMTTVQHASPPARDTSHHH